MNEPCNNCIRGLVFTTKELCGHCGATGFAPQNVAVPPHIEVTVNEAGEKKAVEKAPKKVLKKK